jgi:hypothetical protein
VMLFCSRSPAIMSTAARFNNSCFFVYLTTFFFSVTWLYSVEWEITELLIKGMRLGKSWRKSRHVGRRGKNKAKVMWSWKGPYSINRLKTEFLLNNTYKSSLYLTGNTLLYRYRAQSVNAVQRKSHSLLWEPYETHKYILWAECRVLVC